MEYQYTQAPCPLPPDKDPAYRRGERKNLSRIFFGLFFYLLVSSFVAAALGLMTSIIAPEWQESQSYLFWAQVAPAYLIGFPLCWLMLSGCPQKIPEKQKFPFKNRVLFLAIAYAALYGGNLIGVYFNQIISTITGIEGGSGMSEIMNQMSPLLVLLLVVIIGPIIEEILFRRIVLTRLLPYSERLAVLLSGLLFGLFHGNLQQFFYAFFVGCVLGYVYLKTGKLRHTILMHMLLNLTGSFIPLLFQRQSQTSAALAASINPWKMLFGLFSLAIFVLAICGLWLFFLNLKDFKLKKEGERGLSMSNQIWLSIGNGGMIAFLVLSAASFIGSLFLT